MTIWSLSQETVNEPQKIHHSSSYRNRSPQKRRKRRSRDFKRMRPNEGFDVNFIELKNLFHHVDPLFSENAGLGTMIKTSGSVGPRAGDLDAFPNE